MLDYNHSKYLMLNVYLPYFCEENIPEYTMYIGKIESILESSDINGISIVGDFNAEPGKLYFNELTKLCDEYDLIVSDVEKLSQDSFTHVNNGSLKKSWVDHCVTSPCLNTITDIYIDNQETISDHFQFLLLGISRGVLNDVIYEGN